MWGDDIMVSPVVTPSDASTTMTTQSIWLPPGIWFEETSGSLLQGSESAPTIRTKPFDISEVPVYVRAGSIIPSIPIVIGSTLGLAQQQYTTLEFNVYPGASNGTTQVYEDDGSTTAYLESAYVFTTASYTINDGVFEFGIQSAGNYSAFPLARSYVIRLINSMPPSDVFVQGAAVPYARFGGANTWTYDGVRMAVIIQTNILPTAEPVQIVVSIDSSASLQLSGIRGGISHAILAKEYLDQLGITPGTKVVTGGALDRLSAVTDAFTYLAGTNPNAFQQQVEAFPTMFQDALEEIEALKALPEHKAYPLSLLNSAF